MTTTVTRTPDLTAQVDGNATVFTTPDVWESGTLVVFLNGQRLRQGVAEDYVPALSRDAFTMAIAPRANDTLHAQYEVLDTLGGYPVVLATGVPIS